MKMCETVNGCNTCKARTSSFLDASAHRTDDAIQFSIARPFSRLSTRNTNYSVYFILLLFVVLLGVKKIMLKLSLFYKLNMHGQVVRKAALSSLHACADSYKHTLALVRKQQAACAVHFSMLISHSSFVVYILPSSMHVLHTYVASTQCTL